MSKEMVKAESSDSLDPRENIIILLQRYIPDLTRISREGLGGYENDIQAYVNILQIVDFLHIPDFPPENLKGELRKKFLNLPSSISESMNDPEEDGWIEATAAAYAFKQLFPNTPNQPSMSERTYKHHLRVASNILVDQPEDAAATLLQMVSLKPEKRSEIRSIISNEQAFKDLWNNREHAIHSVGLDYVLEALAEIVLIWPEARKYFHLQEIELTEAFELVKIKHNPFLELKLIWSLVVLTGTEGYVDDHGIVQVVYNSKRLPKHTPLPLRSSV